MPWLALLSIVLLTAAGALLFALFSYEEREERRQMRSIREGLLYRRLREELKQLQRFDIDHVRIECSGVTVVSVCPVHTLLSFSFMQNGNSKRNAEFTRLYAALIAEDFPLFAKRGVYKQRKYRVYRINGKPEIAYSFTMRRGYKDWLLTQQRSVQLRIY